MKQLLACGLFFVAAVNLAAQSVGKGVQPAPAGGAQQAAPSPAPSAVAPNTAEPVRQPATPDVYPVGSGATWGSAITRSSGRSGSGWAGTARGFGAGMDSDVHTWATTAYGGGDFTGGRGGAGYGGGRYAGGLERFGSPRVSTAGLAGESDALLNTVRSSLAADPAFGSLQAELVGGIVFLRGTLSDPTADDRAVGLTRSIPGVRGVILRVSRGGS